MARTQSVLPRLVCHKTASGHHKVEGECILDCNAIYISVTKPQAVITRSSYTFMGSTSQQRKGCMSQNRKRSSQGREMHHCLLTISFGMSQNRKRSSQGRVIDKAFIIELNCSMSQNRKRSSQGRAMRNGLSGDNSFKDMSQNRKRSSQGRVQANKYYQEAERIALSQNRKRSSQGREMHHCLLTISFGMSQNRKRSSQGREGIQKP